MKSKNRLIKEFSEFNNSNELKAITTNRFVYYKSNPSLRDQIEKNGITPITIDKSFQINKPAIVVINSYDKLDWFDLRYDDVWQIDTHSIKNSFFKDPNSRPDDFTDFKYLFTFDSIPRKSIKLYQKGSGKNLLN